MSRRFPRSCLTLLCALYLLTSGCGGPLSDARTEFERGHYAAARQLLASMERTGVWAVPERTGYALYRGLTCGALGDVPRARVWLSQARSLRDAHPDALSPDDDSRLRAALQTYEVGP
jgi:hypothetical protein